MDAEMVPWREGAEGIQKKNCVVLVAVPQTKGLEFDAVVLFGDGARWDRAFQSGDGIFRNRIYVAASRAKQALSIVTRGRVPFLQPLLQAKICVDVADPAGRKRRRRKAKRPKTVGRKVQDRLAGSADGTK